MAVTAEVQTVLDAVAALDMGPIDEQTPEAMREAFAALSATASKDEVDRTTDLRVPTPAGDVPVRVYVPLEAGDGPHPGLVYLHGGGWVIGSIETHDHTCRSLANGAGVVVVSVGYRLAPEHPYPAALDDCLAAVRWVADSAHELGIDADRLAVGGDSAGGNLATLACHRLRDSGPPLRFQLLVYPGTDLVLSHPSIDENADGYMLTKDTMRWFRRHYLAGRDPADPAISPLRAAPDVLRGLPPALVITAEHDPLRDEGEAYAEALRPAGVPATATRYDGMIHGFFGMPDLIPEGRTALHEAATALRTALA